VTYYNEKIYVVCSKLKSIQCIHVFNVNTYERLPDIVIGGDVGDVRDLAFSSPANSLYLLDIENRQVNQFGEDGQFIDTWDTADACGYVQTFVIYVEVVLPSDIFTPPLGEVKTPPIG